MRLGSPIGDMYPRWRFVAEDLYGITDRVREDDTDCRLAWNLETHQFGLFRWVAMEGLGQAWLLGRKLAVYGYEPDARVLEEQDSSDISRKANPAAYMRQMRKGLALLEERAGKEYRDSVGEHAEKFVHNVARSAGACNRVYVPRAV